MNLPLAPIGRRQAERTSEYLAKQQVTTIYSSPLLRAMETASLIAAPHNVEIKTEAGLVEVDVGRWEGRDWGDIETNDRDTFTRFQADPSKYGYADGENMQDVQDRVVPVFEELLARHAGEQLMVISHNVVNRTYLAYLLGIPTRHCRNIQQDNCGVNIVEQHLKSGSTVVRSLNLIDHLADAFTEYPA